MAGRRLGTHRPSGRPLSRRRLLSHAGAVAAAALLSHIPAAGSSAQETTSGLTGRVVLPGDRAYPTARFDFNRRFDVHPQAIVYCQNATDVANAVAWARLQKLPLSVRSGGHCYEGFSLSPGLVTDLSDINQVSVDSVGQSVTAGAGIRLADFYHTLWDYGLTVPGGTCASVGLGGLALGGGAGFVTRKWGLTSDNLRSLELVDASGRQLTASETENADLFWACRGGAAALASSPH